MGNVGSNPYQPNHGDLAVALTVNVIANVDLSVAVPAGTRARPLSIIVNMTTEATAANRLVHITFDRIIAPFNRIIVTNPQLASTQLDHFYCEGNIPAGVVAIASLTNPMTSNWLMNPGDTVDTIVENMQALDVINSLILYHESWIIAG